MIGHICFENYHISLRVCKKLVSAFNKASSDEIFTYTNIIQNTLPIHDSIMSCRMEWLLGIAQLKIIKPLNSNA